MQNKIPAEMIKEKGMWSNNRSMFISPIGGTDRQTPWQTMDRPSVIMLDTLLLQWIQQLEPCLYYTFNFIEPHIFSHSIQIVLKKYGRVSEWNNWT